ncbi:MAG: ABC transporter ATP-binding protein [Deltaproteobacteria bacterium]|nr:ABC transporter ATP-binding protein [Deltaproteobacteria bacterium]
MNDSIVIRADNVSKKFCRTIKHIMTYGAIDITRDFFGIKSNTEKLRDGEFGAVNDVSFELKKGETLGIIGHNGSGKSTMLKMLNGIYMPDKGRIEINGRVGALIEVGAGFHPMLTGRENIYINGAILGMSKKEIDEKYDEIVEFADIGNFINSPVRHYSSGMFVRLGMAIAVSLQPEILLIDEVLSVGDISFQNKSMRRLAEIREKANAVVFVSHNMEHIRALCQKVLVLHKGRSIFYGDPYETINKYNALSRDIILKGAKDSDSLLHKQGRQSSGQIEILDFGILDISGRKADRLRVGEDIVFYVNFLSNVNIEEPLIGVTVVDEKNTICMWHINADKKIKFAPILQAVKYNFEIRLLAPAILPGVYNFHFTLRDEKIYETYERIFNIESFVIEGNAHNRGIIACDSAWKLDII